MVPIDRWPFLTGGLQDWVHSIHVLLVTSTESCTEQVVLYTYVKIYIQAYILHVFGENRYV